MFAGEYSHQIDSKNRIRIPAKLRKELGENYFITKGGNGCLYVFSKDKLETLVQELNEISPFDVDAQRPLRLLFSSGFEPEEDNQGRIILPEKLKKYAGIDKNLTIIGAGTKIEIWSEERWNDYSEEEDFDALLGSLAKLSKKEKNNG